MMTESWDDSRSKSIAKFLVNNLSGTICLKSVDASATYKSIVQIDGLCDSKDWKGQCHTSYY